MASTVFTFSGMMGDNCFRIPIAFQWAVENEQKVDIVLDEYSAVMGSLFTAQPWVDNLEVHSGITGHGLGGQPLDFGKQEYFESRWENVYHLGFREYPHTNLTLDAYDHSGVSVDRSKLLTNRPLGTTLQPVKDLAIHAMSSLISRGEESRNSIAPIMHELSKRFERIRIIGREKDRDFYSSLFTVPNIELFDDQGDWNKTVEVFTHSILIGTYSSMWALMASCVRGPQVVMMPPGQWNAARLSSPDREKLIYPGDPGRLLQEVDILLAHGPFE